MLNLLTLDKRGVLLAGVFGILIFFLGRDLGLVFLTDMLVFLVMAAAVTDIGKVKKEGIGTYEKARGWRNVLSNGMMPLFLAFLYYANSTGTPFLPKEFIALLYISSVAAVTADKFSSEIGILDGDPVMLVTLKRVKKGTSGGVTMLGTAASLFGAFVISMSVFALSLPQNIAVSAWPLAYSQDANLVRLALLLIILISGLFGSFIDSMLGYFEEKGIGNKYTSNFVCSLAGSLFCAVVSGFVVGFVACC